MNIISAKPSPDYYDITRHYPPYYDAKSATLLRNIIALRRNIYGYYNKKSMTLQRKICDIMTRKSGHTTVNGMPALYYKEDNSR